MLKAIRKRKPLSKETKLKISKANKGRKFSPEISKKLSLLRKGRIPWNKGKKGLQKHTIEHRKRMSELMKGEKSPLWKGGIHPINKAIRKSLEYRLWREAVFERDNWTCIWCGARSGNSKKVILNADHIKRFSDYPELRFTIDNGRTLCRECHLTTETMGRKIYEKV